MDKRLKVFLTGGEDIGWALDTDLRLAKQALEPVVDLVSEPQSADVIHTVWPEQLVEDENHYNLVGTRPIVAAFCNDPFALLEQCPKLHRTLQKISCVAQSRRAQTNLKQLGIESTWIPYIADLENFKPNELLNKADLRSFLGLPEDAFCVGTFQRDSLGADLNQIKPQKGADVLLGILIGLKKRIGDRLHVVLGGPRRHWIRSKLKENGIAYTFFGEEILQDDFPQNILSSAKIAEISQAIDVNLIHSRWEGGPRALLENAACKVPVLSTRVGMVEDFLDDAAIYEDISSGIHQLHQHFLERKLDSTIESNFKKVHENHSVAAVSKKWKHFYSTQNFSINQNLKERKIHWQPQRTFKSKLLLKAGRMKKQFLGSKKKTITIWGEMVDGPYGGGSQFLKALRSELIRIGYRVLNNSIEPTDGHVLNSTWFDIEKAARVIKGSSAPALHRIDGPICLYRGKDRNIDEEIFDFNKKIASVTAFQSVHSWEESVKLGFQAINPQIIRNACDPALFYSKENQSFSKKSGRKFRIISSSWSTNPKKGFAAYEYLDNHLNFDEVEYTFVGRSSVDFKNIKLVDAVASDRLGEYLRNSDLYITASLQDPASNALFEALHCGLPVIYANSGGHPEFAWYAGLKFNEAKKIPELINKISEDYGSYQAAVYYKSIKEITQQYLQALGLE